MSRRKLARAGVLAFGALALAACSDSTTAPLNVTSDQLASIGETIATEIEGGVTQLTASDVMSTNGGAPTLSRVPRSSASMFRGLSFSRASSSASDVAACGVPSQNPPVDTDGDLIPDNWSLTFGGTACHFEDATSSYDVTGALTISDPQPGTPGLAMNYGLNNFKLSFNGSEGSGYVLRDGTGSVSVAPSGLSQSGHWHEAVLVTGVASATADLDWTSTFAVAQGQSIAVGQPLPDGTYQPNGSLSFRQGNAVATFSVETITPLQYSASCAAGVAQGTSIAPFSAGRVRVTVTSQQGSGYADVTYSSCNAAAAVVVVSQ
jgi:hypothetical protein